MRARWKLGQLLAEIDRATHPGKGKVMLSGLTSLLKRLGLTRPTALAAERIGSLPDEELDKAFAYAHRNDILNTFAERARSLRQTPACLSAAHLTKPAIRKSKKR
jgi:hypothetical protein